MNKISASVFALAMIVFISGCNSTGSSNSDSNSSQTASVETNSGISGETDNADSSAVVLSDTKESTPIVPENSTYRLIGAYVDDEDNVCVDLNDWQVSEDYDLFRQYFFGIWDPTDISLETNTTIDDSEAFFGMKQHIFHFHEFYQISDNVLAFTMSGNATGLIFWLITDNPDIVYVTEFAWPGMFFSYDMSEPGFLTKVGDSPNEPSNGFLSIFKLREMSRDYGIALDLLTDIEYGVVDGEYLLHSAKYDFYPMYLVSETNDKIVIRTSVGNVTNNEITPIDIICTFERTDGEWNRTVELV